MSTTEYIRGFEAGMRAMAQGPYRGVLEAIHSLDRYWLEHRGFVLLPGETEIRRRDFAEWQVVRDEIIQRATGHNILVKEPG